MKTTKNKLKLITIILMFFATNMFSQTFVPKSSGTNYILYDISIPPNSNTVAYAAGSQNTIGNLGIIIKTVDAGETWQTIYPTSGTTLGLRKIKFLSDLRGFAIGHGNTLLKTTDAGVTWTNVTVQNNIYYYACIDFYDVNKGFLCAITNASTLVAYKTIDSGETWTQIPNTTNIFFQDVTYASENVMYSTGEDQKVSKSIDGGNTWTIIKSGVNSYYNFNVDFKDDNNGIVSSEDGVVLKTSDGGVSWSQILSTGYENLYGLYYKDNKIVTAGTDQNIYYSSNNGTNFSPLNTAATSTATLYDIEEFSNGVALVSGSQGSMLKSENLLNTQNQITENNFNHYYNSNTKLLKIESQIGFEINKVQLLSLDGKIVLTSKTSGNDVEIDLNSIVTGVYIVKLNSNEGVSNSFKFIKN